MKALIYKIAALCVLATAAPADEFSDALQAYLTDNVATWASDPALVAAIRAQNAETEGYDQARIDELDIVWRAQVGSPDAELVASTMSNPAAEFLRTKVEETGGAMTEAFIMDARGLNVAVSQPTSDYWQGDEAKFTETYGVGVSGVHIGDVEVDQSTQAVQGQVSITVVDPETGEAVGALTVGVNLTALM